MSPRRAAKIDLMQTPIVYELRKLGFSVEPRMARVGKGFPDILVGKYGLNILVEIKNDSKGKLTADEIIWHDNWEGQVLVGWNVPMIIEEFVKIYDKIRDRNWVDELNWFLNKLEESER